MVLTGRANNNNSQLLQSPDLSTKIQTVECFSYSEADAAQEASRDQKRKVRAYMISTSEIEAIDIIRFSTLLDLMAPSPIRLEM